MHKEMDKKIILLTPRGFCAGVVRAIDVVKIALDLYGAPIYVRKEIVHNRHVVDELRGAGAIFVEELDEVPEGARVIFSAHGVSPAVRAQAKERNLHVIDATCPLVTKVHLEAVKFAKKGYTIVLIGHKDHDEVIGTLGEAPESTILVSTVDDVDRLEVKDPERVSYITQTTLSLDETKDIVARLKERFPKIQGPAAQDICYATENRQLAVKAVVPLCQVLLVVGSQNSSNSRRLVEVCEKMGVPAYLIDDLSEVKPEWLDGVRPSRLRRALGAGKSGGGIDRVVCKSAGSTSSKKWKSRKRTCGSICLPNLAARCRLQTDCARMSPSLQLADALTCRVARRLRGAASIICSACRRRKGTGGRDLTADTTLESDFILLELWRHPPQNGVWNPPTRPLIDKSGAVDSRPPVARWRIQYLRRGPSEISATVKAYTALKLAGLDYDDPNLTPGAGAHSGAGRIAGAPIATSRSTSACSACIRASIRPRFRRKACCSAI